MNVPYPEYSYSPRTRRYTNATNLRIICTWNQRSFYDSANGGLCAQRLCNCHLFVAGGTRGREKGGGANAVQGLWDCVLSNERTTAAAMSVVD